MRNIYGIYNGDAIVVDWRLQVLQFFYREIKTKHKPLSKEEQEEIDR
jgi:hypothetical protein